MSISLAISIHRNFLSLDQCLLELVRLLLGEDVRLDEESYEEVCERSEVENIQPDRECLTRSGDAGNGLVFGSKFRADDLLAGSVTANILS